MIISPYELEKVGHREFMYRWHFQNYGQEEETCIMIIILAARYG